MLKNIKSYYDYITEFGTKYPKSLYEKRKIKLLNILFLIALFNSTSYIITYSFIDFYKLFYLILSAFLFNFIYAFGIYLNKINQTILSKHLICISPTLSVGFAFFIQNGTNINLHYFFLLFSFIPLVVWNLKEIRPILIYFLFNSFLFLYAQLFYDISQTTPIFPAEMANVTSVLSIILSQFGILATLWINLSFVEFNEKQLFIKSDELLVLINDINEKSKEIFINNEKLDELNLELSIKNNKLTNLNATKDKFFSIIAHDLKNPIGNFKNTTQMMQKFYNSFSEEERVQTISMMKESSEYIYALLENLLEWSKTQSGTITLNLQQFDLNFLGNSITQLLNLSAEQKKISLINEIENDFLITADANLINTVIRNLVSNAIKFTQECGTIKFGAISSKSSDNFNEIHIYVKDTGVGMPPEIINKLFKIEENVSNKGTSGESGTGLGLILCKEFVEKHGGKIWVESEEGKGSTFWFSLPSN